MAQIKHRKPLKRGALTKRNSVPISIPVPVSWDTPLNRAIAQLDTDRSKFVRGALVEKLTRMGITVPPLDS